MTRRLSQLLLIAAATQVTAATVQLPPGAVTDCGAGYASYAVRQEIAVAHGSPIETQRLRWGPMFGVPSPAAELRCRTTEAEGALPTLYEESRGLAPGTVGYQGAQDLSLVLGLGLQVAREHCATVGPCVPERAVLVTRDDAGWCPSRPRPGSGDPRNCYARADEMPCGVQPTWNVYWLLSEWIDNRAPHCGGAPPPPEPPVDPQVDPPAPPPTNPCPAGQSCRGECSPPPACPDCPPAPPCPPPPPCPDCPELPRCWALNGWAIETRAKRLCDRLMARADALAGPACETYRWLHDEREAGHVLCEVVLP